VPQPVFLAQKKPSRSKRSSLLSFNVSGEEKGFYEIDPRGQFSLMMFSL